MTKSIFCLNSLAKKHLLQKKTKKNMGIYEHTFAATINIIFQIVSDERKSCEYAKLLLRIHYASHY